MAENKRRTKNTANPTDTAPPQEQDRHMEPERLRNPRRVTCCRTRRGKPQAPQEEAYKQTPARVSTKAYPAQSRRREGRHSSTSSQSTHTTTQGQPGMRLAVKNRKARHCRRRPKRRTGRRSQKATPPAQPGNSSASTKIPQPQTEIPGFEEKTATLATPRKATTRSCPVSCCANSADATGINAGQRTNSRIKTNNGT